jgi:hypothetical protein
LPWAKRDVQHADVKLLSIRRRVDPKTLAVEELTALGALGAAVKRIVLVAAIVAALPH